MIHYHLVGVGGIGMSALAHLLLDRGFRVTGEDREDSPLIGPLLERGLKEEFQISARTICVYSGAVGSDHPTLLAARSQHCLMIHRAEALHWIIGDRPRIVVTGTHGKSSTAACLVHLLIHARRDIGWAIGAESPSLSCHGHWGSENEIFITEGDESNSYCFDQPCDGAILTNLEADHLDF
ncbi:MAG: Mur ligase domain-containing protein, partial [Chlamydiota bacterium]|nr:Mur ligase domain-containing protein [Chlamydiota bacterium]